MLLGSVEYSTPIDIWGVGCIFSEMVSGRPIFPGSTNEEQIVLIWQILGTPTESSWEGVSQLPEYKPEEWPECEKQDLAHQMPRLNRVGLELVDRMVQFNPKMRYSAQEAMSHPYFASLAVPKTLGPSKPVSPSASLPFPAIPSAVQIFVHVRARACVCVYLIVAVLSFHFCFVLQRNRFLAWRTL